MYIYIYTHIRVFIYIVVLCVYIYIHIHVATWIHEARGRVLLSMWAYQPADPAEFQVGHLFSASFTSGHGAVTKAGLLRCGSFRKFGGILFWGPYNKDPTI